MPQTRLARNQRLRRNRQTELVREVIPLCNRNSAGVQFKEFMGLIQSARGTGVMLRAEITTLILRSYALTEN